MTTNEHEHHHGPYLAFTLAISLLALGALALDTLMHLDPNTHEILEWADHAVCFFFFVDFLISLAKAPNKKDYFLRWGWLDLISSIPAVSTLRWGRIARIVRVLRVLRGIRSARVLAKFLLDRRAEGTFLAATLISVLLVVIGSISILQLERTPEANIKTAEDALWWSVVTITTVGYGDRYPVTSEGRLLATLLMTAGVGLFGVFSGFVAAWFLKPGDQKNASELALIRQELQQLRTLIANDRGTSL